MQPTDETIPAFSRRHEIGLRAVQAALLAYAGYRLFRVLREEQGFFAVGWSIPWIIALIMTLLIIPTLVRLGWRRFGRPGPTWAVTTVISTMSWVVATMLCWMVLSIVVILSD